MSRLRRVQWLTDRLPEPVVYTLVRARNGELPAQQRARTRLRSGFGHGAVVAAGYLPTPVSMRGPQARVVTEFDAVEVRRANILAISQLLETRGIRHVLVPGAATSEKRIAVSMEDRAATLTALRTGLTGPEWAVASAAPAPKPPAPPIDAKNSVRVYRLLAAPSGVVVADVELACHLDFWTRVERSDMRRPDGGMFAPGTRISPVPLVGIVAYLSPDSWHAATSALDHWPPTASTQTLFQVREPIDIVYTWVDGDDPAWQARKPAAEHGIAVGGLNTSATHESRFRSRDELRYSLRSVAMYANWVRKIYIVTDRQAPPWLDLTNPRVEIVDHRQIFSDPSVLPVFNSHAIESQLHHIDGLSETYLYLNDDVFLGRPVDPELFFHGNGAGKFFLSRSTLDIDSPSPQDLPVMSAAKRNRTLLQQRFGATVIHKFKHTPHAQLRSLLTEMEREYPDLFEQVARSRFRHPDDLSIASALHHYYAYGLGQAMPAEIEYTYQDVSRSDTARRLANLARTRNYDVFCLNDHETAPELAATQDALLADFFDRYFPVPSEFELARADERRSSALESLVPASGDDLGLQSGAAAGARGAVPQPTR